MNYTNAASRYDLLLLELQTRSLTRRHIEVIAWSILELLIIIGNTATIQIIVSNRHLRTVPNYLIISLAMSDLGLGIFAGIICLAVLLKSKWPFSAAVCQFHGVVALTMASASVLNLTLMALNRYYRVVKPQKYRTYFNARKTAFYILFLWLMACTAAVLYLVTGNQYKFNPGKFFCYIQLDHHVFLSCIVTMYIILPAMVVSYCYWKVYGVINKHNKSMSGWASTGHAQRGSGLTVQEINITRTLFTIVVAFLTCWSPVFIIDIIDVFRMRWSLRRQVYLTYTFLVATSSSINPILYGILNPVFRKEYLKIFIFMRCFPKCAPAVWPNGQVASSSLRNARA